MVLLSGRILLLLVSVRSKEEGGMIFPAAALKKRGIGQGGKLGGKNPASLRGRM